MRKGMHFVECVECGKNFLTQAGNKFHCGNARDKDSCAGQHANRRKNHGRKEPEKKVRMESPVQVYDTRRLEQLRLIKKHNRAVRLLPTRH